MYGTLISSVTVGAGGASTIDFTSIPQTPYTDLIVVYSARTSVVAVSAQLSLKFNASTGYTAKELLGSGSAVYSFSQSGANFAIPGAGAVGNGATANTFANSIIYIPNYASSTNKSFSIDDVNENNGSESWQTIYAGIWSNTAAINQITLYPNGGTIQQYSTAYLYGLQKGSGGATVS